MKKVLQSKLYRRTLNLWEKVKVLKNNKGHRSSHGMLCILQREGALWLQLAAIKYTTMILPDSCVSAIVRNYLCVFYS